MSIRWSLINWVATYSRQDESISIGRIGSGLLGGFFGGDRRD